VVSVTDPSGHISRFYVSLLNLGFTQPLIEMSTRSRKIMLLGSTTQPVLRTDNLSAICEPIV
jgi:hypothetical protein